jgi:hypothetical protein
VAYDREKAAELVLALMCLTLHDERRAWKGYDWDVLALLHEQGLILDPRGRAKSVVLTDEGLARSRQMHEKYLELGNREDR